MKFVGKVLLMSALMLVVAVAASNASAAPKSHNSATTNGLVWGGGNGLIWSGGNGAAATANHGHQQEQATHEQGCFSGTASDKARCLARSAATKVIGFVEGLIWGGSGT